MRKQLLLDCTLRDGGYINDWAFGKENIAYIFERQVSSHVDFIEVGFLDERRKYDPERTILPDTRSVEKTFGHFVKNQSKTVAMIDYGTCGIENIQSCSNSWLDGIRVIFKKEVMRPAIEYCKKIKELGYLVFVQAVSITSYSDEELNELIDLVNEFSPYALSMVDTYGLLHMEHLSHIIDVIDKRLDANIILGYHAHNNFQLGYANVITMLTSRINRDILVDGSLYGMGKSAGNAPIELIAMYMNACCGKNYDIEQMQEAIVTSLLDIYKTEPWGYKLFYYIAASNGCHPDYVNYLMNKRTLSVTSINEILQRIPDAQKLGKNMKMLEELYLAYQKNECNDDEDKAQLTEIIKGKKVLMLGPGAKMRMQKERVNAYIEKENPFIISINYVPDSIRPDMLFVTNAQRYRQMISRLAQEHTDLPIIATSNVTRTGGKFPYVLNYSTLIDPNAEFADNSMVMLLKLLRTIGVSYIAMAGFDGYTPDTMNYFSSHMEYSFVKQKADVLNRYGHDFLTEYRKTIDVEFVTDTLYE